MTQPITVEHDWQRMSAGNARVLLRCLVNTLRLANGPREVASVLRVFGRSLVYRLRGSTEACDETLRLQGVTHVLGLGTGELLTPQEIYSEGAYDRLPDFVPRPDWIVFDVGANSGVYAVRQARRGATIYAFEPNPHCFRRLRRSVALNDLDRLISVRNCALGAAAGSAELRVPDGLTTMGSLRPEWDSAGGGVVVEVETIDRVAASLKTTRIDLLKVDVEGLEIDVLQGAANTLALVDRVVVEYHSRALGRQVSEHLAQYGLTTVLDEKMYEGDEEQFKGIGRGMLFAARHPCR